MSLFRIFNIAGSGMSAQTVRLNLTASNVSNAESIASGPDEAYKARHPVFGAMLSEQMQRHADAVGVRTLGVVESQAENVARYAPDHPLANESGYIYASNVNFIEEMTNMISASRSYQNNVEVLNTSKELLLRTLRLGE